MTQDKAPEWATEQAASINLVLPYLHVQQTIALALSQAYERGQVDMRERATKLIDEGFDRPDIVHKVDKCAHGLYGWEDCEQCASAAIRSLPIEQERGE